MAAALGRLLAGREVLQPALPGYAGKRPGGRLMAIQLVWYKRDLRVRDHRPLADAAAAGPVLPLYVVEDDYWRQPDTAQRHWAFIRESLTELRRALADLGLPLLIRRGEAVNVLEGIRRQSRIAALHSHEETGNRWTYDRDRAVAAWARQHGVDWHETPQFGVIRGLKQRDGWARQWTRRMQAPITATPESALGAEAPASEGLPRTLGFDTRACPGRQAGGRSNGEAILKGFLHQRGEAYQAGMSSPVTAWEACSRLSPHIAYGTVSLREIHQATEARRQTLRELPRAERGGWLKSLSAFNSRLHWHCHFMQKLEDQPGIEFENIHRGYDGMREHAFDPDRFEAWAEGRTGLPFVDACMRALHETGWINFRMRAMLMAVAAYHLWLHWREPALHLARLFTDYEPGIHYSQAQMQSGTTGINTLRIYNPVKQSRDQAPEGAFIRRWVPELAPLANGDVHEPWKLSKAAQTAAGVVIGRDYPEPIVDHLAAARSARRAVQAYRRRDDVRDEARRVQKRHGSRSGRRNTQRER